MSHPRSLPPISPHSEPQELGNDVPKKRRKKKRPPSADMASEEYGSLSRSGSRSRAESDVSGNEGNLTPSSGRRRSRSGSRASQRSSTGQADPGADQSGQSKPRRKKKRPVTESHETLVEPKDEVSMNPSASQGSQAKKKRRRKKKSQAVDSELGDSEPEIGLAAELNDLGDDVVVASATENGLEESRWVTPIMKSEPTSKLYIEQRNGFKTTDKAKVARKRAEQLQMTYDVPLAATTLTTLQFGLSTHRVFKTVSVMLQGLFSGFALWQIISVYLLSNHGWDIFLLYYYQVALAVQSMYYFLFAFSIVAVFDRYDIGNLTRRTLIRGVSMQSGAVACLFYIIGLIFNLSIAYIDDKIWLSNKREFEELWKDEADRDSELDKWRILNLMRGIFAMLGWLVVALRPGTDKLTKNLENAQENIIELPEAVRSSGV